MKTVQPTGVRFPHTPRHPTRGPNLGILFDLTRKNAKEALVDAALTRNPSTFESKKSWERNDWETPDGVLYEGHLLSMPDEVAAKVAEIHPNFESYMEKSMAILYKHRVFRSGTEDPVSSIASLMTGKEYNEYGDNPWVVIWQIIQ